MCFIGSKEVEYGKGWVGQFSSVRADDDAFALIFHASCNAPVFIWLVLYAEDSVPFSGSVCGKTIVESSLGGFLPRVEVFKPAENISFIRKTSVDGKVDAFVSVAAVHFIIGFAGCLYINGVGLIHVEVGKCVKYIACPVFDANFFLCQFH